MCGIVGGAAVGNGPGELSKIIRRMAEGVKHRGPDDEGYFVGPRVALGHRRLSIIDLETGRQPMSTPDGRFTIVFNGEIFNYRILRDDLISKGATFRSSSDTEVLLQGFARYGPEYLERLDGMFAFLLYDSRADVLYAGRDPFGIKPLYVAKTGPGYLFASEIKVLRTELGTVRKVSPDALDSYLSLGYCLGRKTLLEGIERISPGSVATVDESGTFREEPFSRKLLPGNLRVAFGTDPKSVLIRAVERSLVSDVPVGLYLSGGIDSSLIASIVTKELGKKLTSFSVSFPGEGAFDEGEYARETAEVLGLEHRRIECTARDFFDLDATLEKLEEPMNDPSAIPLLKLSGLAAKEVKVVLSGEGGDELFGGYHRYYWDKVCLPYAQIPRVFRRIAEGILSLAASERFQRRLTKLRDTGSLSRGARYASWFCPFAFDERKEILRDSVNQPAKTARLFEGLFTGATLLPETAKPQWVDLVTFLRDDLLPKADKMSMANGLEVRVPFLQGDVAQAAFSLRESERVKARDTKPYLRRLLRNYLPPRLADRPKQGFEIPIGKWLRGDLKELVDKYLDEDRVRARGLVSSEVVKRIRDEHITGKADRGPALYTLITLEVWCRKFLDC